jgi:DNA-binding NarL/FixJ family response regulator
MTFSISGAVSGQPANTYTPAPAATQQAPQPQPSGDTVALSQSAQINQLNLQGQSAKQIAEALGIPVSTVDSDLGIVAATVTSNAAGAPAATFTRNTSGA